MKVGQRALVLVSVIYAVLALGAWRQAVLAALPHASQPRMLGAVQLVVGTLAAAVAWGCWRRRRWAGPVAIVYGIATGGMIASLGPMLDLPSDARRGLWTGAAAVFLFGVATAWLVRRADCSRIRGRALTHG